MTISNINWRGRLQWNEMAKVAVWARPEFDRLSKKFPDLWLPSNEKANEIAHSYGLSGFCIPKSDSDQTGKATLYRQMNEFKQIKGVSKDDLKRIRLWYHATNAYIQEDSYKKHLLKEQEETKKKEIGEQEEAKKKEIEEQEEPKKQGPKKTVAKQTKHCCSSAEVHLLSLFALALLIMVILHCIGHNVTLHNATQHNATQHNATQHNATRVVEEDTRRTGWDAFNRMFFPLDEWLHRKNRALESAVVLQFNQLYNWFYPPKAVAIRPASAWFAPATLPTPTPTRTGFFRKSTPLPAVRDWYSYITVQSILNVIAVVAILTRLKPFYRWIIVDDGH
jgi:hypothetical protein